MKASVRIEEKLLLAQTGLVTPVQGTLCHHHHDHSNSQKYCCYVSYIIIIIIIITIIIIINILPTLVFRGSAGHSIGTQASFGPEKLNTDVRKEVLGEYFVSLAPKASKGAFYSFHQFQVI